MNSKSCTKLFLGDLEVDETEIFFARNKEVSKVDVIGTVVRLHDCESLQKFDIDDGTGIIQCVKFHADDSEDECSSVDEEDTSSDEDALEELKDILIKPLSPLELGDLVNIRGYLNVYKQQPQIIAYTLRRVSDSNEEWFRIMEIDAKLRASEASASSAKKSIRRQRV